MEVAIPAVEAAVLVVRGAEQIEDVVVCPLRLDVAALIWEVVQTVVPQYIRVTHFAFLIWGVVQTVASQDVWVTHFAFLIWGVGQTEVFQ